MAKKNQEEKPRKRSRFTDLIAFFALFLSVVLFLIGPILRKFAGSLGNDIASIMATVAQVFLVTALAIPAWYFARRRGIVWKVVYIVCLIVFVVGIVLGYAL